MPDIDSQRIQTTRGSGFSKVVAVLSTAALLVLMLGIFIWVRVLEPAGAFRKTLDAPEIVKQVQQLNQLATVRYVVQKVVGMTEEKQPLGAESILLMVEGRALAGVDLASCTQYNVNELAPGTVVFHMPPPKIIEVFIDEKNTKVWDRHVTWWTPWIPPDPDLEHKARLQAIEDIRKTVIADGILIQARQNAETAIRRFLEAFGMKVTFK